MKSCSINHNFAIFYSFFILKIYFIYYNKFTRSKLLNRSTTAFFKTLNILTVAYNKSSISLCIYLL